MSAYHFLNVMKIDFLTLTIISVYMIKLTFI